MKIILAVHHFPPRYAAGAELRTLRTASWLRKAGHDASVVCVERISHNEDTVFSWEDDEYEGVPVRRLSFDLDRAPHRFRWQYDNSWIEEHLSGYFEQRKPDVFHMISGYLMGVGALRAAHRLGIPIVITITDFWFVCARLNLLPPTGGLCDPQSLDVKTCTRCRFEEKRRFRLPARMLPWAADLFWSRAFSAGWGTKLGIKTVEGQFRERNQTLSEMLSVASVIVCPSWFLIETLRTRGLPPEKLVWIPHGLDKSAWLPVVEPDELKETFRIGYMGQIEGHKGIHLIVQALSRLEVSVPLELRIYGNELAFPRYTSHLRRLAKGDPRVKIMGRYPYEKVAQILSELDVLVIPSLWNEIGPWVMYEAFETKTPVVATHIPNMSYMVRHNENGLLFERGDVGDLAHQLQRLIEDSDLRSALSAGIKPVMTIAEEMEELQRVYQSAVPQVTRSRRGKSGG
jgi:glycosyltransferase involved in cell wall biosynthesis